MHAYLIIGSTGEERRKRAHGLLAEHGAAETIELPAPKTKHFIKAIRELNHRLSLKSSDDMKPRGVILEEAYLLTTEAANSFLKTLEEPTGNTIIILTAPNADLVLPTIASRCTNIEYRIGNLEFREEEKKKSNELFVKLLRAGVGERLKFVEGVGTRQDALGFCVGQLHAARTLLLGNVNSTKTKGYTDTSGCIPPKELAALIDRIDQTRRDLEANVNVKLCLADLLLSYPKASI